MPPPDPLVDAESLLALTAELRAVRDQVEVAEVTEDQRVRWQRTLAAIAEGATADLEKARAQLRRFAAQIERSTGSR